MNFDKLVECILQESKTVTLPPAAEKILTNIVDWIVGLCDPINNGYYQLNLEQVATDKFGEDTSQIHLTS